MIRLNFRSPDFSNGIITYAEGKTQFEALKLGLIWLNRHGWSNYSVCAYHNDTKLPFKLNICGGFAQ